MPAKELHQGIDTLPFDLFARIADPAKAEKAEDHVEDWEAIVEAFAREITGGDKIKDPAATLEAQISALNIKQARLAGLVADYRALKAAGSQALEIAAALRAEGVNPDAPQAAEANVNMQIKMREQALSRLTGKDGEGKPKEPPKYRDYIHTLLSISRLHKTQYDPRQITTLQYCLLYSDAQAESKAAEDAAKNPKK